MSKSCPFCGKNPKVTLRNASEQEPLVTCKNEKCVLWDLSMGQEDWEHRFLKIKLKINELVLVEQLGEAFHSGFRKAADCKEAMPIHRLIDKMPREDWLAVLQWVVNGVPWDQIFTTENKP
jgi:hypothetical protein